MESFKEIVHDKIKVAFITRNALFMYNIYILKNIPIPLIKVIDRMKDLLRCMILLPRFMELNISCFIY